MQRVGRLCESASPEEIIRYLNIHLLLYSFGKFQFHELHAVCAFALGHSESAVKVKTGELEQIGELKSVLFLSAFSIAFVMPNYSSGNNHNHYNHDDDDYEGHRQIRGFRSNRPYIRPG